MLSKSAVRGKKIWEENNCIGCHMLLGEGACYGPELTRVYDRRGPAFIAAMLRDPEPVRHGSDRLPSKLEVCNEAVHRHHHACDES